MSYCLRRPWQLESRERKGDVHNTVGLILGEQSARVWELWTRQKVMEIHLEILSLFVSAQQVFVWVPLCEAFHDTSDVSPVGIFHDSRHLPPKKKKNPI